MSSFGSFAEGGVWLVLACAGAGVLLVARRYVAPPLRTWLAPLYWLLLPYLALLFGAVSPRLMGIFRIDWRATFQVGGGLLLAISALAVIAWLFAMPHAAPRQERPPDQSRRLLLIGLAGAEEWFWCFLRATLWEIALGLPQWNGSPLYWSAWIAALLALPLALLLQPSGPLRLIKVVILAVTTVVFLFTHNFWLCWFVHAALALLFIPAMQRTVSASLPTA